MDDSTKLLPKSHSKSKHMKPALPVKSHYSGILQQEGAICPECRSRNVVSAGGVAGGSGTVCRDCGALVGP